MKNQLLFTLLLVAIIFAHACKKEQAAILPEPGKPTEPVVLSSLIVGKWNIGSSVSRKLEEQEAMLSIEFFEDSTYIVAMSSGSIYTGKYGITDTTNINIAELGTFSDIKIEGEKLNFRFSAQGGSILITANKAAEIPAGDGTTKICRTWQLVSENWSPFTFGWSGEQWDVRARFSSSGTYLITVHSLQDSLADVRSTDWKWSPSASNNIQYTGYNYNIGQTTTHSADIIQLTSDSLVIKDWYYTYPYDGIKRDTILNSRLHTFVPVSQ